jgi:hypothetical protein
MRSRDRTVGARGHLFGWLGTLFLLGVVLIKLLRLETQLGQGAAVNFALGVAPSFLGPAGFVFLLLSGGGRAARLSVFQVALLVGVLSGALEFLQLLPRPGILSRIHYTFDVYDFVATVAGVATAYLVATAILRNSMKPIGTRHHRNGGGHEAN